MNILIGLGAIVVLVLLYQSVRKDIDDLRLRLDKMEESKIKRINVYSLEELEHAMAELAALSIEHDLKGERISHIRDHLSKAHTPTKEK